ncbi:unnamed protein product [Toxocara canis]|uniref:Metalloendopeptidase n=1 Tax=Toxocara canis TaxID=6265 RepID=A0A183UCJ0_TOXCA|nr:unnamed protein product [Toxocara canis]
MSSCSPMLTPTYGITPTEQQLALPAGAILRGRHNRRKAIYYGRLPASGLLGIIILVHTSILAIWMLREYYFFDFKCAILRYEFGSAADVDEEKTTRNAAHNDASIRHSRARIPRQSQLSHSSSPTSTSSFNNDLRLQSFRIMQLKSATALSLHRRRRSVACDSRKYNIHTHCQQHVIWADSHNSRSRKRKVLGEPRTISKRSQRNEESEQQSASFDILHSSNVGDSKKANNDRRIPGNRNEQPRSFPSESLRVRKGRSQQRANVNQFGRPVGPRVDLPTSSPKLMYRGHSTQVNNSHIRDEKIVNRNTMTRIKTSPENVSRHGARLKPTQQTHTTKTARLGPPSVIRNRNGTRLKTNNRKPLTKGASNNGQLAPSRPGPKSFTGTRSGSGPKTKPNQNDRKNVQLSSVRNATGRRLQPKKHKSGESWESNEAKPTKKRFHFLSGPSTSTRRNTTHRTSWINGIIDPADENFSNKGDIRFYRGRLANKKPKRLKGLKSTAAPGSAARLGKLSGLQQHMANEERKSSDNEENGRVISRRPKNATSSEDSAEIKKKAQRKWKTAEDVVRRPSPRVKSSKEHLKKGSGSREADSSSESQFSSGTKLTMAPETIKSSSTSNVFVALPVYLQMFMRFS